MMTREQTIHSTVPFSMLATGMLVAAIALLVATFFISTPIYRYFCLGAFVSMLSSTVLILAVTKVVIWPATIVLCRGGTPAA